jgi:hypothetical protein
MCPRLFAQTPADTGWSTESSRGRNPNAAPTALAGLVPMSANWRPYDHFLWIPWDGIKTFTERFYGQRLRQPFVSRPGGVDSTRTPDRIEVMGVRCEL